MTIKNVTNLNLIFGLIHIGLLLASTHSELSDQINSFGLIAIIWFNWESLKVIKGQKRTLTIFTFIVGLLVILFSCLVVLGGILRMIEGNINGWFVLSIFEIVSGATFLFQGIWSLRNNWKIKRNASQLEVRK